jgi:cell division protein ZipA
MEPNVRYWLIVIGAVLIIGVLLDAFRRHRNERRNPIRLRKTRFGMGGGFAPDAAVPEAVDELSPELPAGGARVVRPRDAADAVSATIAPVRERREPRFGKSEELPRTPDSQAAPREPAMPESRAPLSTRIAAAAEPQSKSSTSAEPNEVVVLHVLARDAAGFNGGDLLRVLRACDVRFGEMNIFHRHEEEKGRGAVQFSVANATEPGSFDLDRIEAFHTPGLSFFMRLPGPQKPLEAFDCMLETARVIVKNLDGELRDASNSAFTAQTGEHCRQRIREFAQRARALR